MWLYQCLLVETLTLAFTIHLDWTIVLFRARYWTAGLMHCRQVPPLRHAPCSPLIVPKLVTLNSHWSFPQPPYGAVSLPAAAAGPWISGILSGSLRQAWLSHLYSLTENSTKTWGLRGERDPGAGTHGGDSEEGTCTQRRTDSAPQQHTDVEVSMLRTPMKELLVV